MREYYSLALTIVAIFAITFAGAYFSPTFSQQRTFLELFILFGSLLFIFSLVVIVAAIGFSSFSLYIAFFLAAVMGIYGVEGAFLVTSLSYITWGAVFSMQSLLFYNRVKSAKEWFVDRYNFKSFKNEYYLFYPMLVTAYIFLEFIPSIFYREDFLNFHPSKLLELMEETLE
jgi:hypothetical protein